MTDNPKTKRNVVEPYKSIEAAIPTAPMIGITGRSGVGKSTWAVSALSWSKDILFLELEHGAFTASLDNAGCQAWLQRKQVPQIPINQVYRINTFEQFHQTLHEVVFKPTRKAGTPSYIAPDGSVRPLRGVVIDSATRLSQLLEIQYNVYSGGNSIAAWGSIKRYWIQLFDHFEMAGILSIWTVHTKDMFQGASIVPQDKQGLDAAPREASKYIVPDITGSGRDEFVRRCSWLVILERTGKGDRTKINIYTDLHDDIYGKMRGNFKPKEIDKSLGEMLNESGY